MSSYLILTGLAVNIRDNLLYWTDEVYEHIMISDLAGRLPNVLVKNVASPRNIEVDLKFG